MFARQFAGGRLVRRNGASLNPRSLDGQMVVPGSRVFNQTSIYK